MTGAGSDAALATWSLYLLYRREEHPMPINTERRESEGRSYVGVGDWADHYILRALTHAD